jgi:hypothetical protein
MAAALASLIGARCRQAPSTDLVLLHGKIVTMDPARPEAQALAVHGDRISAVGRDDEISRLVGASTRVLDLRGRLAVPGFIETHAHFVGLGRFRLRLRLNDARSWDEVVALVAEAVEKTPPGAWISGRGWHQEKWSAPPRPEVGGYPTRAALDRAAPAHPVLLKHASGHAAIANARALAIAGVGAATPDPPGGRILKGEDGSPTGLLIETAADLVEKAMEAESERRPAGEREAELRREIEISGEECLSKGVTTFHDAGSSFEVIDLMRRMAESGQLPVRLWVMVEEPNEVLAARLGGSRIIGAGNGHLTVRAIKRYMDGALGSRGAWLLEPYSDQPSTTGLNVEPVAKLEETAKLAAQHGFQMCVHAIGDRAVRETLDLYERVLARRADASRLRWRIEHAQNVAPSDLRRFASVGVIAAMQGIHCVSDAPWVVERLGEARAREVAYPWRRLIVAGAMICSGSDAPFEDVDPISGFHALVTRLAADGRSFFPEQRMTREEALRSYTVHGAWAAFEEDVKGSLTPGKLADITVLSRDLLSVPDEEIRSTRVLYTIVGGEVRYRDAGAE